MRGENKARREKRDRMLQELGPRPAWWRSFARRRWQKRHDEIMSFDVSNAAAWLASIYTPESIERAARQLPTFSALRSRK